MGAADISIAIEGAPDDDDISIAGAEEGMGADDLADPAPRALDSAFFFGAP